MKKGKERTEELTQKLKSMAGYDISAIESVR